MGTKRGSASYSCASYGFFRKRRRSGPYAFGSRRGPGTGTASAVRFGGSRTRTITKRKRRGRLAKRRYRARRRFQRKVVSALSNVIYPKSNYHTVYTQQATDTFNVQSVCCPLMLFTQPDCSAMIGEARGYEYKYNNSDQVIVIGYYAELRMTNQVNENVIVDLYTCRPRRDLSTADASGANSPPYITYLWERGLNEQSGSSNQHKVVGCTPYQSQKFTELISIKSKQRIVLQAGASKILYFKSKRYRKLDNEIIGRTSPPAFFRNLSTIYMAVCQGFPVNDSVNAGSVATGSTKVDFVANITYYFEVPQTTSSISTLATSLGAITNAEEVMNMFNSNKSDEKQA